MQKAHKRSTKITILLIIGTLIFSAVLFGVCIFIGSAKMQSDADAAEEKAVKQLAAEAAPVDLAGKLRRNTVAYVYEKEAIPAYSYNEIWNMDVSKPSGVTAEDLKLVTGGGLVGLEDAFVKAEKDHGINCLFVMGIASLESANGTICFKPNNMFGFGSSGFSSKEECIDVVAEALANNYLTPGASLYNGHRITDVNRRYAASSTWDEKVCRNMARYYSVISRHRSEQLNKLK